MKLAKSKLFAAALIAVSAGAALAGQTAPSESKGVSAEVVGLLPLETQIPAMKGYQLRARKVTIAPGGVVAQHGHETRPGLFHMVEGALIEVRGDTETKVGTGGTVLEGVDATHWVKNTSDQPNHLFVIDIVPVQ